MGMDCPSNLPVHAGCSLLPLCLLWPCFPLSSWRLSPAGVVGDGEGQAGSVVPWGCEGGRLGHPQPLLFPCPSSSNIRAGAQRNPSLGELFIFCPGTEKPGRDAPSAQSAWLGLVSSVQVLWRRGRHSRRVTCFTKNA